MIAAAWESLKYLGSLARSIAPQPSLLPMLGWLGKARSQVSAKPIARVAAHRYALSQRQNGLQPNYSTHLRPFGSLAAAMDGGCFRPADGEYVKTPRKSRISASPGHGRRPAAGCGRTTWDTRHLARRTTCGKLALT